MGTCLFIPCRTVVQAPGDSLHRIFQPEKWLHTLSLVIGHKVILGPFRKVSSMQLNDKVQIYSRAQVILLIPHSVVGSLLRHVNIYM